MEEDTTPLFFDIEAPSATTLAPARPPGGQESPPTINKLPSSTTTTTTRKDNDDYPVLATDGDRTVPKGGDTLETTMSSSSDTKRPKAKQVTKKTKRVKKTMATDGLETMDHVSDETGNTKKRKTPKTKKTKRGVNKKTTTTTTSNGSKANGVDLEEKEVGINTKPKSKTTKKGKQTKKFKVEEGGEEQGESPKCTANCNPTKQGSLTNKTDKQKTPSCTPETVSVQQDNLMLDDSFSLLEEDIAGMVHAAGLLEDREQQEEAAESTSIIAPARLIENDRNSEVRRSPREVVEFHFKRNDGGQGVIRMNPDGTCQIIEQEGSPRAQQQEPDEEEVCGLPISTCRAICVIKAIIVLVLSIILMFTAGTPSTTMIPSSVAAPQRHLETSLFQEVEPWIIPKDQDENPFQDPSSPQHRALD